MSDDRLAEVQDLLARVLTALDPVLDQVVLVGGWVLAFYRRLPDASSTDLPDIRTLDIDILVPESQVEVDLARRLGARQIEPLFSRDDATAHRYQDAAYGQAPAPVFVDILAPLCGSATDRKGRDRAVGNYGGLSTQRLRYLDLVLVAPLRVDSGGVTGVERVIQIPHPCTYMLQKALIRRSRVGAEKRDKDLVYLFETALVTRRRWPDYPRVLHEVRMRIPGSDRWCTRAAVQLRRLFDRPAAEGPIVVSRYYREFGAPTGWTEEAVVRVMKGCFEQTGLA